MKTLKRSWEIRSVSAVCCFVTAFSLPNGQIASCHAADFETQRAAGRFADHYVVKSESLVFDEELTRRVSIVGQRMAKTAERVWPQTKEFKFTFRVTTVPLRFSWQRFQPYKI